MDWRFSREGADALVGLAALLGAYGTAAGKAIEKRAAEIKG